MPAIWRALTSAGSRRITRKTTQARQGATSAAARTPSFASSSCWPSKARLEISSETVKPMPATVAPPAVTGQLSPRRRPSSHGRDASQTAPRMPSGLPTT